MPATMEQETLAPVSTAITSSLNPTVTYDLSKKEIRVQVIVFLNADKQVDHITPPCAVPYGSWKVLFEVVPDQSLGGGLPPPLDGITPTSQKPGGITNLSHQIVSATQGLVCLTNAVTDVNSLSYTISVGGKPHDPTIAVVKDPLEPPAV